MTTTLLAGASGLVGRELLAQLLADPQAGQIHALVRSELPLTHAKLRQHHVALANPASWPTLPPIDEALIALGTTIKVAGSQSAFRAVDFSAVLAVAQAARAAGARRLGVVSAMGADARSRVFYSRVKGEMEQALAGLGFESLVIARPSMLAGERQALGQPVRSGEQWALQLTRWLKPLIPANYRSVQARQVAAGLLAGLREGRPGTHVVLSGELQRA